MDPDFLRLMGFGPQRQRPLDVRLQRALSELGRLGQLVPAAMVSGPVLQDEVIAECERVCIAAAARFAAARAALAMDPVKALTPAVLRPEDDE